MPVITSSNELGDGVCIGGQHLHHPIKIMTNSELTLDQLKTVAGGGVFAKLDGIKARRNGKVHSSSDGVFLGPLGGEGVFLGPLGGEGVFITQSVEMKGSVIVGDKHF